MQMKEWMKANDGNVKYNNIILWILLLYSLVIYLYFIGIEGGKKAHITFQVQSLHYKI